MHCILEGVHALMSAKQGKDVDARDFRQRSTITAHKHPTKTRLHDEQRVGESYEETILRLLDEIARLRSEEDPEKVTA